MEKDTKKQREQTNWMVLTAIRIKMSDVVSWINKYDYLLKTFSWNELIFVMAFFILYYVLSS